MKIFTKKIEIYLTFLIFLLFFIYEEVFINRKGNLLKRRPPSELTIVRCQLK